MHNRVPAILSPLAQYLPYVGIFMGLEDPPAKVQRTTKGSAGQGHEEAFYYATKWFTIIRATAKGEPRYVIAEGGT